MGSEVFSEFHCLVSEVSHSYPNTRSQTLELTLVRVTQIGPLRARIAPNQAATAGRDQLLQNAQDTGPD